MDIDSLTTSLSQKLLDVEQLADTVMPLESALSAIQMDIADSLAELKIKSENSEDFADKIFYLNRYADLVKKIDSIFDNQIKRTQNSLSVLSKLNLISKTDPNTIDVNNSDDGLLNRNFANLTPEQCARIFAILQETEDKDVSRI